MKYFAIACWTAMLALPMTACGSEKPTLHLVGEESGRTGDITVFGKSGTASWTWGQQKFSQTFDVVEDQIIPGPARGGSMKLKLKDGTVLELAGEYNVFACSEGCESSHMPIAWKIAAD